MIIDHRHSKLDVADAEITMVRETLHIAYGHTSHGSQITEGMRGLVTWSGGGSKYNFNSLGTGWILQLYDYYTDFGHLGMANDLGNPNRTAWESATRIFLTSHPTINVIMWSWCGQVANLTAAEVTTYLNLMEGLERDFPGVHFVYFTDYTNGTSLTSNMAVRNKQIRDYCIANNKILYDFSDIESYDPDGNYFGNKLVNDGCYYDSNGDGTLDANWALSWQSAHPGEWFSCTAAHTQPLNANMKAYAAWRMFVELAKIIDSGETPMTIEKQLTFSLEVLAPANIFCEVSPISLSVRKGHPANFQITIQSLEDFAGLVGMSLSGLGAGMLATFGESSFALVAGATKVVPLAITTDDATVGAVQLQLNIIGQES